MRKGNPNLKAGPGRPKGSQNKVPKEIRAMLREALDNAGGAAYLTQQAKDNPTAFMTLVGKLIPAEVKATVSVKTWEELVLESAKEAGQ